MAKEWKELLLADERIWDQNGFNDIVHRQLGPSVDEDSGLVYAYDGNLKLGLLPASIFCSGHTYFVQVGDLVNNSQPFEFFFFKKKITYALLFVFFNASTCLKEFWLDPVIP